MGQIVFVGLGLHDEHGISLGGLEEVRAAAGDVVHRRGAEVGEIAASAAGDQNLVSESRLVLEDEHAPSAPARHLGAEQPGGTSADDDDIVVQPARRFRKTAGKTSRESRRVAPRCG